MAKRRPRHRPPLRERVRTRAEDCCEYCRLPQDYDPLPFHVEHVIPKKHGGRTLLGNLALSCPGCNFAKSSNIAGLDPNTGDLTRLFHPRSDIWDDHFAWEGVVLAGKTDVGRTTVDVLAINEAERVQLRDLLTRLRVVARQQRS